MKTSKTNRLSLPLSMLLVAVSLPGGAATVTWTNLAGGSWNTAANWSPNHVPGIDDAAVIAIENCDRTFGVNLDANITVSGLSLGAMGSCAGPQTLSLNGRTLTLNGPLMVTDCGQFNLDSGVLMGGSGAVVSGIVTWSGGVLNGTVTVATNGVLLLTGPPSGFHGLYGAVTNCGLIKLVGGDLELQGNYTGMLINLRGGMIDIQTNLTVYSYNNRGTIFNWGILRQSDSTGTTTIRPHFFNYGLVDSQSGTLSFIGGGELNDGSSFGGSAVAQLADGIYTLNGTVHGTNAMLSGAGLMGTDGVLSGQWIWTNGYFAGGSTLTVGNNGQLTLAGTMGADYVLYGILTNAGTIKLTSGNLLCQGNVQGLLINLQGAVIDLTDNVSAYNYNNRGALVNWGTLRKSGGGDLSTLRLTLHNHGTVEAQTGTVAHTGPAMLLDGGSRIIGTGTNLIGEESVTLNGDFEAQNLVLAGATLRDKGGFAGMIYWSAGRLEDGASLTVGTNASLVFTGPDQKVIVGLLNNQGTIVFSGTGRLAMGSLSAIAAVDNRVGAVFEVRNNAPVAWTGYSQPAFTNAGLFRKTGESGTTVFDRVIFQNSGTVDVQSGTVAYTSTGSAFEDGSRLTGNGTNLLASGIIDLRGAIYAENLEFGGATISGSPMLSGKIYWSKGLIADGAILAIAHNGILVIQGPDEKGCLGLIENEGAIFVYGTGRVGFGSKSGPRSLYNRVGGLFDLVDDTPIAWTGFSQPAFTNAGMFRKSGGTGTVALDGIIFGNSGTVNAQAGTILFNASGSVFGDGTSFLGRGTNLLAAGTIQLGGRIYAENLELGGSTIIGTNTLSGSIYWSKGEIRYDAAVTIAPDALLTLGGTELKGLTGTMDNQGTVRVTGRGTFGLGSKSGLAWINNRQSALFELAGDTPIYWTAYDQPAFTNSGVFRKSAGSGTTSLAGIIFHNEGIVAAETGTIGFNTAGSIFDHGTRFIGSGTNLLFGGNITLSGSIYSQNLLIAGTGLLGTNFLTGAVTWRSGSILATAVLTVNSNTTLRIDGPDQKGIIGALNNQGLVQLSGTGTLAMGSQNGLAVINNHSGAIFETLSDAPIVHTAFDPPAFTNMGVFRKRGGASTTLVQGVILYNRGTLEVETGTLSFSTTGTEFGDGTRFVGAGTNLLNGGLITLSGSIYSENLWLAGLGMVGTNTLSGTVNWSSGFITPTAMLGIGTNCTLRIDGSDQKGITGVLNNQGRIVLAGTGTLAIGSQTTPAVILNQPGAIFEAIADAPITWTAYSQPFFTNAGTFRRTGCGATVITMPFMNPGTLDIQSGVVTLAGGYDLSGGRLNFGLASLTNYGRLSIASGAFLRGTLSAECLGGYQPAAGNSFAVLGFTSRNGGFDREEFPPCAAWQTMYDTTALSLQVLNARPTLAELPLQRVDELKPLTATNVAVHADGKAQTLTFGLDASPQGMKIDPLSGVITWTPAQTQSPSTNLVRVFVTDSGTPVLSSTNSFLAIVREVNMPPVLPPLATQTVNELTQLRVANTANEPNIHSLTLGYSLLKSPASAAITQDGIITWTPGQEQSPGTYLIITVVTNSNPYDDVNPSLAATNQFTVIVKEVNVAPVLPPLATQTTYELTWLTVTNTAAEPNIHSTTAGYRLEKAPASMTIEADGIISWVPNHSQAPATNLVITVVSNSNPFDLVSPTLSTTNQFLVIVYERPQLTTPGVSSGGSFQFTFMTVSGETYTVQYSTDLKNWVSMSTFEGFGGPLTIKDPSWSQRLACYYRLQIGR